MVTCNLEKRLTLLGNKIYSYNSMAFQWYAEKLILLRTRVILTIVGLALGVFLVAGVSQLEFETDLDDLWIEKGTRVIAEKDYYDQWFGGLSRTEIVAVLNKDLSSIATKQALDALVEVTEPLLTNATKSTTTFADGLEATVEASDLCSRPPVPDVFKPWTPVDPAGVWQDNIGESNTEEGWIAKGNLATDLVVQTKTNLAGLFSSLVNCANAEVKTWVDTLINNAECRQLLNVLEGRGTETINTAGCSTGSDSTVYCCDPNFFRPWIDDNGDRIYAVNQATGEVNASVANNPELWRGPRYEQIYWWFLKSTVLEANDELPNYPGMRWGWGVPRFPCLRANPLDCFNEGKYDMPEELLEVETYMSGIAALGELDQVQEQVEDYFTEFDTGGEYAAMGVTVDENNAWEQCEIDHAAELNTKGVSIQNARQVVRGTVGESIVGLFVGLGYWWKPTYSTMNDATINSHMIRSIRNTNAKETEALSCALSGLLRIAEDLTDRTWNPSDFTSTDHVWDDGEIDDTKTELEPLQDLNGECCLAWPGVKVPDQLYSGGYEADLSDEDNIIRALRIVLILEHPNNPFLKDRLCTDNGVCDRTEEEREELIKEYEQVWIDLIRPNWEEEQGTGFGDGEKYEQLNFLFYMERSVKDMLDDATTLETAILIVGYLAIFIYSMLVLTKLFPCPVKSGHFVYSRSGITFCGVWIVIMSTVGSFGLFGYLGVPQSPLSATLVPFLSLGLGIDDMFVLLSSLTYYQVHQDNVESRMIATLADSGPSVSVTSLANVAAFLIASIVRLPAVQLFAWQMAFAVFTNWLFLMLIFTQLMWQNSIDVSKKKSMCVETDTPEQDLEYSPIRDFCRDTLGPIYMKPAFKITILVSQAILTAIMIWLGFYKTEEGLALTDVATRGTYVRDYLEVQFDYFFSYNVAMVTRDVPNYKEFQYNVIQFINDTETNEFLSQSLPLSDTCAWWGLAEFAEDSATFPLGTFYKRILAIYFNTGGATSLDSFVCLRDGETVVPCDQIADNNVDIVASRCTAFTTFLEEHEDFKDAVVSLRKTGDASYGNAYCKLKDPDTSVEGSCTGFENPDGLSCGLQNCVVDVDEDGQNIYNEDELVQYGEKDVPIYFYGFPFKFWEQYLKLEENLYKTVGFGVLGVFCATMTMQFSPRSSFLVALMILSVCIQLYGFMYLIDVKRNAFSVVNLVVAVGAAVEFTSHICHVFLISPGSKDERMAASLTEMVPPLFNGAMTSFFSVVALAFSRFPFFRQYYFAMISLMLVLCVWNGMVVLPVLLSYIGPPSVDQVRKSSLKIGVNMAARHSVSEQVQKGDGRALWKKASAAPENDTDSNAILDDGL